MITKNKVSRTKENKKENVAKDNNEDIIVIKNPFKDPWKILTVIFAIAFIVTVFLYYQKANNLSGEKAGKKLVEFLNSRADGTIGYISSQDLGSVYEITISYLGQQIPVYVTKDGEYFIQTIIQISDNSLLKDVSENDVGNNENIIINASVDDDPVLGNKNAPVTIIEFSDYECPFCGRFFSETLPLLKKEYIDTGKVILVYRDFPLDIHPNAQKAAEAAECVGEKSDLAYYKMHDLIFDNQEQLSTDNLKKLAKNLGYNIDNCLDSDKMKPEVEKDLQDGLNYGVDGTPTFFINGMILSGAQPFSAFKDIIEKELNRELVE